MNRNTKINTLTNLLRHCDDTTLSAIYNVVYKLLAKDGE